MTTTNGSARRFGQTSTAGSARAALPSLACVEQGLRHTLELRRLAQARGARFHLVVVPKREEVAAGRHAQLTQRFLEQVRGHQVKVHELREALTPDDYWPHDGHFAPSGARKAAKHILERLR